MPGPSDRDFLLARFVAYSTWQTFRRTAVWDREDIEQDAYVALIAEWPNLTRRFPDGVPEAVVVQTTRSRLIDVLRQRTHWRSAVPQSPTVNIEAVIEPADDFDTEREALGRDMDAAAADEVIDHLLKHCTSHRPLVRYALRRICEGATQAAIAEERGVTNSWVNKVLAPLRDYRTIGGDL